VGTAIFIGVFWGDFWMVLGKPGKTVFNR